MGQKEKERGIYNKIPLEIYYIPIYIRKIQPIHLGENKKEKRYIYRKNTKK